ncbi:MAG: hypothetical protein JNM13_01955 [Hyphomicrobiaceae bacterium]|nr:hypothetical protein [Hyphomicrobiaceae bacterium]
MATLKTGKGPRETAPARRLVPKMRDFARPAYVGDCELPWRGRFDFP